MEVATLSVTYGRSAMNDFRSFGDTGYSDFVGHDAVEGLPEFDHLGDRTPMAEVLVEGRHFREDATRSGLGGEGQGLRCDPRGLFRIACPDVGDGSSCEV